MSPLRLDSAARDEFLHEIKYYEFTRLGSGAKFREAVGRTFARIQRTPASGKPDEEGCRRVRINGFPFSVVYREETSEIVVYAVRPDARKPGYWLERVR